MHDIMFIIKFQIFSKKISFYKLIILILIPFKKLFMHRAKFVNFWGTSRHIRSKFLTIIRHIIFSFYSQITFTHVIQIRLFSFISREEISILSVTTLRYSGLFSQNFTENSTILFALKLVTVYFHISTRIVVTTETTRLWIAFRFRPIQYKRIKLTFKPVELVGSNATRPRRTLLSSAYVFVRDANPPICIGLR